MSLVKIDDLDSKNFILIKGARTHNLKNIDIAIRRNQLVVITGVSGSGKSSLAFDTLYADGQRRYVESLSSYARQFLGRMQKPEADYIKGISPAIAIEQKVNTHNPRSTVGTSSEIYEYLKLLFARIGKTYSPISGQEVKRHSVTDVVDFIESIPEGIPVIIGSEIEQNTGRNLSDQLQILRQQAFTRLFQNGKIIKLDDLLNQIQAVGDLTCEKSNSKTQDLPQLQIVIDRLMAQCF